jgi:hypothetical protein
MSDYTLDQLKTAVVKILDDKTKTIAGSGFIIRSDGYLITCQHVIYRLASLTVEYQGQEYQAQWCPAYSNPDRDIAVLKIEVAQANAAPLIQPEELPGTVSVYGFPQSRARQFTEGFDVSVRQIQPSAPINTLATYPQDVAASLEKLPNKQPWNVLPQEHATFEAYRLVDATVDPGASGGPVLAEESGGVVGVIQCSGSQESYAIRWDNISGELDQLGLEPHKNAVRRFLAALEDRFKYLRLFHGPEIVLQDQYIPIQVSLEVARREVEDFFTRYAESDEELRRAYALKGMGEEQEKTQVDWTEAKKEHQRLMVLADPGMGKTTLLKQEVLTSVREQNQKLAQNAMTVTEVVLPIFLRLSELAEQSGELSEAIPTLIGRDYPSTARPIAALIRKKLEQGQCLLLLDALDEVPAVQRARLAERVERFARNAPGPIICTSRIVGYGGFLPGLKEVEIVPFRQKQIEQYVETWFKNLARSAKAKLLQPNHRFGTPDDLQPKLRFGTPDDLIRELRNKPQIRGLAQNPLLLSLVCSLYQEEQLTLPARRVEVYAQAIKFMLTDWRRQRTGSQPPSEWRITAKLRLLENLAYQFTCEEREVFPAEALYARIEGYLQGEQVPTLFKNTDSDALLRELTEEDGILQKLDWQGDNYLFLHRTFQEYFTASYLNHQPNGIALAREHFWDFDWHETLILFAGLRDDPLPFLQALVAEAEKDDIFASLLLLTGRCLAECGNPVQPAMAAVVDRIDRLWRSARYRDFTRSTVVALGQVNERLLTQVQQALHDTDEKVRGKAARGLGEIGDAQAVAGLLVALHDADREVRGSAAQALGEIGDAQAVAGLLVALHDADERVRGSAAQALGAIGDTRAVAGLLAALHDADREVRWKAARALGAIENTQAVAGLLIALHDADYWVRRSVAQALEKIGDAQAVAGLFGALHDADEKVRGSAAEALGEIGDAQAVAGLLIALHDADEEVRG